MWTSVTRFRAGPLPGQFFHAENGIGAVFREIPSTIMTAEQLGLPPVISKLASLPRGLVIVTGPTGSGKSTTLAAIIDVANRTRSDHIITVEDPIEFVHKSRSCLVNHREVGLHTKSFSAALRGALREDPDIILVGEMRDLETISLAIEASATGIWYSAPCTPPARPKRWTVSSRCSPPRSRPRSAPPSPTASGPLFPRRCSNALTRRARAGHGNLIATPAVRNLIRESKSHQLPSMMQTGKKYGMQLLDDAIMDLYNKGRISADDAYTKANDKGRFRPLLKSPPTDFTEA
jgi:twitching motility protein PilT